MSFYETCLNAQSRDQDALFADVTGARIIQAIESDVCSVDQLRALLSPLAAQYLEQMAQRAHELTLRHFGKTIQLYAPLYLSNHCDNACLYCGFNTDNDIERKALTLDEVRGKL